MVTLTLVVDRLKVWMTLAVARSLEHMCLLLRCSDMLQTFVQELRDVVTTQCSSRSICQFQRMFRRKSFQIRADEQIK